MVLSRQQSQYPLGHLALNQETSPHLWIKEDSEQHGPARAQIQSQEEPEQSVVLGLSLNFGFKLQSQLLE